MKSSISAIGRVSRLIPVMAALCLFAAPAVIAQGTLSALDSEVDRLADKARPSVVTVLAERVVMVPSRTGGEIERVRKRVGSGVAVGSDIIVTTASVVLGSERFVIQTSNGLRARAKLLGADPIFNVAVLQASNVRLPALQFSSGRPSRVGEWVMAIGTSPRGMQLTESVGSVAYYHQEPRIPLMQLTNPVHPGYSGGAALNSRGQLIGLVLGQLGGINAPGLIDGNSGPMSFVLTGGTVRYAYERLMKNGHVPHGYLGVTTRAEAVESDGDQSLVPIGARVEAIVPGGPAFAVGLEPGDLIVGFERERVEFPEQLARWVAASEPGSVIRLVWVRDDFQHNGAVELEQSPQQMPQWAVRDARTEPPQDRMRISEIEQQIRRLSDELQRLKTDPRPN